MTDGPIETVEDAFQRFERNTARVPDDQNEDAKEVHPEIRKAVRGVPGHQTSCPAPTAGAPRPTKLKDVDIIVVLDDPDGEYAASASGTLEAVRKVVSRVTSSSATRGCRCAPSRRSCTTTSSTSTSSRRSSRRSGDGLCLTRNLPDEGYDDWTLEDPNGQLQAAQDKNKDDRRHLRPGDARSSRPGTSAIPTAKPLRSYHAESLLYHALTGNAARCTRPCSRSSTTRTTRSRRAPAPPVPGAPTPLRRRPASPRTSARRPARRSRPRARRPTPPPRSRTTRARRWTPG